MSALFQVRGRPDQKIAAIAGRQRGRVARKQLLAIGVTPSMIDCRVVAGRLHRVHHGVYAVGHVAPSEFGRETAALLACGEDAVLSHQTAAAMWKLRPAPPPEVPVELTLTGGKNGRRPGIRVHRARTLDPRDVRTLSGLPVTSPAKTLLDLAEVLSLRELERALDEGFVSRTVRPAEIRELLDRSPGRKGRTLLVSLMERSGGATMTRSQAEERFLALVREAGLPAPEVNARIHGYEVDFLWRERALVVEVDGYRYHSGRTAFERDSTKSAKLTAAGIRVMRVTWLQMAEEPLGVVARLAQAVARAL